MPLKNLAYFQMISPATDFFFHVDFVDFDIYLDNSITVISTHFETRFTSSLKLLQTARSGQHVNFPLT